MHELRGDYVSYRDRNRKNSILEGAHKDPSGHVPLWRVVLRLAAVATIAVLILAPTAASTVAIRVLRGKDAARKHLYRRLVGLLQALGPTYVKYGQIAGTRRDALPAGLCDELSVLHDAVRPLPGRQARRAFREAYGNSLGTIFSSVAEVPDASGSIASVYPAVLADGRAVALKLKRPGIDNRMRADLDLVRRMVKAAEKFPKLRGMPMAELTSYVSQAILGQLDFAREAASIVRLRGILAHLRDVRVPELYAEYSRPECLVFEYIPGLAATTPVTLPAQVRQRLGAVVLTAAHTMMFGHGFVHCDMHPGNVYLTEDGHVVILDAGYSVQIPDRVRRLIGEFFASLHAGNGPRCGEIVLEAAVHVGDLTDVGAFTDDVAALVARAAGGAFDMFTFGNTMFDLQRKHGIYAQSDFAFPLMSLLVLEGTISTIAPDLDFRQVGAVPGRPAAATQPAADAEPAAPEQPSEASDTVSTS